MNELGSGGEEKVTESREIRRWGEMGWDEVTATGGGARGGEQKDVCFNDGEESGKELGAKEGRVGKRHLVVSCKFSL